MCIHINMYLTGGVKVIKLSNAERLWSFLLLWRTGQCPE